MATYAESQFRQIQKKALDLQKKIAGEAKKIGAAHQKMQAARRSKSNTAVVQVAKFQKEISEAEGRRAQLEVKLAAAQEQSYKYSLRVSEEAEKRLKMDTVKADKRLAVEKAAWKRERDDLEVQLQAVLRKKAVHSIAVETEEMTQHDFFISHASDDKEGFVRDFAAELERCGANVWYDEATLKVGDSLRRSIDRGLASSRFGVVVLSEAFFRKEWPQRELDGLTALETTDGESRILPIWHKVSKDEVARFSPVLADRLALNTSTKSISEIANDLMELLPSKRAE
ncbi:toll/interleukin-1 receptor domain-containing protein [Profundibacter sp.]